VGLLIAAGIATAMAVGGLALLLVRSADRVPLALAFLIALPLQPLVFYVVRLPIDGLLRTSFGIAGWVTIVSLFYAPLIEEPTKWLTAAVPAVRHALLKNPVSVALAAGLGFGIGEIWFLARALATAPDYPDLPFWMFGGFMLERLTVCFLHGAFLTLPFTALARGRSFWLGGLAGMLLHFLLNFPIYLAQLDLFGWGAARWVQVLVVWIALMTALCTAMVCTLAYRRRPAQTAPTPP
jgi:RsiW-degrading membrane proteinase PrsW (M82 family)